MDKKKNNKKKQRELSSINWVGRQTDKQADNIQVMGSLPIIQ